MKTLNTLSFEELEIVSGGRQIEGAYRVDGPDPSARDRRIDEHYNNRPPEHLTDAVLTGLGGVVANLKGGPSAMALGFAGGFTSSYLIGALKEGPDR